MGKGKGKRRRQANYVAAHGGASNLPPVLTTRDIAAVPSKLRRIMSLKASPHSPCQVNLDIRKSDDTSKNEIKGLKRKYPIPEDQLKASEAGKHNSSSEAGTNDEIKDSLEHAEKSSPRKKRRRRNEDLLLLTDSLKPTLAHKGLNERKKRYLEEKKKRKKKAESFALHELNQSLYQREKIGFGDVVNAPPKLSFPKKNINISEERLRQRAIETYRQKKKWLSRPGSHQLPSLASDSILNS